VPDIFFAGPTAHQHIFVRDAQGKVVGFVDRREAKTCAGRGSPMADLR
jgi:hypothetical protein